MLGNGVKMGFIFRRILGPLVLGWAPNHFVLEAQLAPVEKRLVRIPATVFIQKLVNTLVGSKLLFTCIGQGHITCLIAI